MCVADMHPSLSMCGPNMVNQCWMNTETDLIIKTWNQFYKVVDLETENKVYQTVERSNIMSLVCMVKETRETDLIMNMI